MREKLFYLLADALQQGDDVCLFFCSKSAESRLVGFLNKHGVPAPRHVLYGTLHVARRVKVVDALTFILELQLLCCLHDVGNLLLSSFCHDILYPLLLHEESLDHVCVTVKENEDVVSQLDGKLVP